MGAYEQCDWSHIMAVLISGWLDNGNKIIGRECAVDSIGCISSMPASFCVFALGKHQPVHP